MGLAFISERGILSMKCLAVSLLSGVVFDGLAGY
jgi:hypothetical protein